MRDSGLNTVVRKKVRYVLGEVCTSLMMLTLDYGVAGHLLDEAPFLACVEIEVEGIYCRDEEK
jgi:hypothetical protein